MIFDLNYQYTYEQQSPQFVDAMVKFSAVIVVVLLSTQLLKTIVKSKFHSELNDQNESLRYILNQ